jgi:hypothetical protein
MVDRTGVESAEGTVQGNPGYRTPARNLRYRYLTGCEVPARRAERHLSRWLRESGRSVENAVLARGIVLNGHARPR